MARLFKNKYRIPSARLPGWDYSSPGAYFVTICTRNRICWFGSVRSGKMYLSDIGKIVFDEWIKTAEIRTNVLLDEFVVMPNHFHGILIIKNDNDKTDATVATTRRVVATTTNNIDHINESQSKPTLKPNSLGSIIGQFKSVCTKQIRKMGYDGFRWQERFHDHIIRNEPEFKRIKYYIRYNPQKWGDDRYHSEGWRKN